MWQHFITAANREAGSPTPAREGEPADERPAVVAAVGEAAARAPVGETETQTASAAEGLGRP